MATNVIYNTTDTSQQKYQKSITNVSPTAQNDDIKTFVQGINALTNNTITGIRRVEITDILNEDPASAKLPRNITFHNHSTDAQITKINAADLSVGAAPDSEFGLAINYAGIAESDTVYVKFTNDYHNNNALSTTSPVFVPASTIYGGSAYFAMYMAKTESSGTVDVSEITVYLPETDTYAAATATIAIE